MNNNIVFQFILAPRQCADAGCRSVWCTAPLRYFFSATNRSKQSTRLGCWENWGSLVYCCLMDRTERWIEWQGTWDNMTRLLQTVVGIELWWPEKSWGQPFHLHRLRRRYWSMPRWPSSHCQTCFQRKSIRLLFRNTWFHRKLPCLILPCHLACWSWSLTLPEWPRQSWTHCRNCEKRNSCCYCSYRLSFHWRWKLDSGRSMLHNWASEGWRSSFHRSRWTSLFHRTTSTGFRMTHWMTPLPLQFQLPPCLSSYPSNKLSCQDDCAI